MSDIFSILSGKKPKKDDDITISSPFIISAWLSPNRKEIYDSSVIYLSTKHVLGEEVSEFTSEYDQDNIFDQVKSVDGLVYVVCKVEFKYSEDYYGEIDCEVFCDVLMESKCSSFFHLKSKWKEIKGSL